MLFDPAIVEAVRDLIPTWLGVVMVVLSYLGSIYFIAPAVILAYWLWRDRLAPIVAGMIGCYGLMSITKSFHSASRPAPGPPVGPEHFPSWFVPWYEHAAHISTTSFPSGHAMAITILVGLLVVELETSTFRRRLLVGLALIGWVGFTRVGLAVHYPGDVLGGFIYGVAFLGLFFGVRVAIATEEGYLRAPVDEVTAAFGVALVFALGAFYVTSGGVENYTFAHASRNSHITVGGAIGGLIAWQLAPAIVQTVRGSRAEIVLPAVGITFVIATWFVANVGIGNRIVIVTWSALFLAAVILVPMLLPGQEPPREETISTIRIRRFVTSITAGMGGKRG